MGAGGGGGLCPLRRLSAQEACRCVPVIAGRLGPSHSLSTEGTPRFDEVLSGDVGKCLVNE